MSHTSGSLEDVSENVNKKERRRKGEFMSSANGGVNAKIENQHQKDKRRELLNEGDCGKRWRGHRWKLVLIESLKLHSHFGGGGGGVERRKFSKWCHAS